MIEYFKWQGHPREDKTNAFFIIQPSRWVTGGFAGPEGAYQYLGWFYMNGNLHFDDRIIHSDAPDLLQDMDIQLTNDQVCQMVKDIFEEDFKVSI